MLKLNFEKYYDNILRNSFIRLKELLFSGVFQPGIVFSGIVDLTKILLMGDNQKITPWIINHWLEHVRNGIIHIKHVDKPSIFLWIGFMDPLSAQKYNAGGDRPRIRERNPIDYFQSIIKRISGERNKDSLKYEEILKDKTEEDYMYVFQQLIYIALRLTEQLDSSNSPWEVDLENFPKIDFNKTTKLDEAEDKKDYDEILKDIISDASCGSSLSSKLNK